MKISSIEKILIVVTFICVISLSLYKLYTNHINNEFRVVESKIIDSAKKCYYDSSCEDGKITINHLINSGYLSNNLVNPKNKEFFNQESYVITADFTFVYELD